MSYEYNCRYFLEVAEYLDEAQLNGGRVFVNCFGNNDEAYTKMSARATAVDRGMAEDSFMSMTFM